mmetsp:Transcript_3880/g.24589  ORF Transcript_3880/g.24589 Transcript_3880/m.24589 type:complete len:344 (+) Transcript_3880:1460-2491(+)
MLRGAQALSVKQSIHWNWRMRSTCSCTGRERTHCRGLGHLRSPAQQCCFGVSFGFFAGGEERVRKRDVVHTHHSWIRCKLRIQVEEDRHVDFLFGLQLLLFEAEALYFVEVDTCLLRAYVVGGHASDGCFAGVFCRVKRECAFSWDDGDVSLRRDEFPRHAVCHVGVKVHGDGSLCCLHFLLFRSFREFLFDGFHSLGGAAESSGLAEQPIQRHRSVRGADHAHGHRHQIQGALVGLFVLLCSRARMPPSACDVRFSRGAPQASHTLHVVHTRHGVEVSPRAPSTCVSNGPRREGRPLHHTVLCCTLDEDNDEHRPFCCPWVRVGSYRHDTKTCKNAERSNLP